MMNEENEENEKREEWQDFDVVCPACESDPNALQSALKKESDYKNVALYHCVNCGPFKIRRKAYRKVKTELLGEGCGPEGRKKFRDLIKKRQGTQGTEECLEITEKEILEIANDPALPSAFKHIIPENALTAIGSRTARFAPAPVGRRLT